MRGQLKLFEIEHRNPDYWLAGTPDLPDQPYKEYICWKIMNGMSLTRELVICEPVERGWEFRDIPLIINVGATGVDRLVSMAFG